MSVLSDALDRLGKYNLNPFSPENVYGFTGVGGMAANWIRALRDIVTAYNGVSSIGGQAQQALTDGQTAAGAAATSASAANTAKGAAQQAQTASETARDKSQAWAESATAPGAAGTKSAKSWSTTAQTWAEGAGEPGAAGSKSAKSWAEYGQTLAQAWAEGAGEPGGAGTKSAKGWAAYAQTLIAAIAGGPVYGVNSRTGNVSGVAEAPVVSANPPLPTTDTDAYGKPYVPGQLWVVSGVKNLWVLHAYVAGACDWRLIASGPVWCGTSSGTANAHTLSGGISVLYAGLKVEFVAGATNTAAATLKVGTAAAASLTDATGTTFVGGELVLGTKYVATYDGTKFRLDAGASNNLVTASTSLNATVTPNELTVDFRTGNKASYTVAGNLKIIPVLPASGGVGYMDLTNPGAATITWSAGKKTAGGAALTFTTAGKDRLTFIGIDGDYEVTNRKDLK